MRGPKHIFLSAVTTAAVNMVELGGSIDTDTYATFGSFPKEGDPNIGPNIL